MAEGPEKYVITYTHRKKQRDKQKDGELLVYSHQVPPGAKSVRVVVKDENGRDVESGEVEKDAIEIGMHDFQNAQANYYVRSLRLMNL